MDINSERTIFDPDRRLSLKLITDDSSSQEATRTNSLYLSVSRSPRILITWTFICAPLLPQLCTQHRDTNCITSLLITLGGSQCKEDMSQIPGRAPKALLSLPWSPLTTFCFPPGTPSVSFTHLLAQTHQGHPALAVPSVWTAAPRLPLGSNCCSDVRSLKKPSLSILLKMAPTLTHTCICLFADCLHQESVSPRRSGTCLGWCDGEAQFSEGIQTCKKQ